MVFWLEFRYISVIYICTQINQKTAMRKTKFKYAMYKANRCTHAVRLRREGTTCRCKYTEYRVQSK